MERPYRDQTSDDDSHPMEVEINVGAPDLTPRRGSDIKKTNSSNRLTRRAAPTLSAPESPEDRRTYNGNDSTDVKYQQYLLATVATICVIVVLVLSLFVEHFPVMLVIGVCCLALIYAVWLLRCRLLVKDEGSPAMQRVSTFIRDGSRGFFGTQYSAIAIFAVVTGLGLFGLFAMRQPVGALQNLSSLNVATATVFSFLLGATCSGAAGFIGMWVSIHTNVRVSSVAGRSYLEAVQVAFNGGTIAALVVVSLAVLGICVMYVLFESMYVDTTGIRSSDIPLLMVGYGFGASFVALFAQLGGGIYTKAADVGADLAGKIEASIPEDDPRNPAVVADLVGDNVGDCAGRGADLFESISAEIISAMILGGSISQRCKVSGRGFVFFPLVIHAFDLVVSSIGSLAVRLRKPYPQGLSSHKRGVDREGAGTPLQILMRGFMLSGVCSLGTFGATCKIFLSTAQAPSAWWHFYVCGMIGMAAGYITVFCTLYYTDTIYRPVISIADASLSGHATNVITGVAVGMESTAIPIITIGAAILGAYYTGESSGLVDAEGVPHGGLFGTAVATMGMLSTAVYMLAMDFFGPIADNAGGIVEMSNQPERVRNVTDELDAVGNTTKAATKGYAVGSALLAAFLLFSAFQDEVTAISSLPFKTVDASQPEILVAGMLGAMMTYLFSAWTILAVGDVAQKVVTEVRRQLRDCPGILDGEEDPDYKQCVSIVAQHSLRKMLKPGALVLIFPVVVGMIFRFIGDAHGDPLLGARAVTAVLIFATVSGVLLSLFLNNAGGAWDNAKKLIETGKNGGKNSAAHEASITGDTVGDPFKDAAGPSLHVVIKLLSTITLVMCPLFVSPIGGGDN